MYVLCFCYLLFFGLAFGLFRGFVEEVHSLPHDVEGEVTLTGVDMKQVFLFSTSHNNWKLYNWSKITTLVEVGYHDDEMVKFAHSKNVTVSYIANIDSSWLTNSSLRSHWVSKVVSYVQTHGLDGVNVDFEEAINFTETDKRLGLTLLLQQLSRSLKSVLPRAQLTIDVAWSPACIDKRCFDYVSLADIADFIFIMAYDERSQVFGSCVAWANSPFNMTLWGIQLYSMLGIPRYKMVLGLPWYGYDYPCASYNAVQHVCHLKSVPFRGVNCSDAAGRQFGYSEMMTKAKQSFTGTLWDNIAQSPYAAYKDEQSGEYHQIWFDDVRSLGIKYKLASDWHLLGVGVWEADSLDYSDSAEKRAYVRDMWNALPDH